MKNQTPIDRINLNGSFESLIERIVTNYNLGKVVNFEVITIGYEDCNTIINTDKGRYLAKIFSKSRKEEEVNRYAEIMQKAFGADINHPRLYSTSSGQWIYKDQFGPSMVLMTYIEGKTFFEMNRTPNKEEIAHIVEQAAKLHKIDYRPKYLFDSWSVQNMQKMIDSVKEYIDDDGMKLVLKVLGIYKSIDFDDLPHAFVHGDFTKTNVLKGNDEKIYFLDFSVANYYPRIQELAVIAANLLYEPNGKSLKDRVEMLIQEYSKHTELTDKEKNALFDYTLSAVAMEFLGAHQEKYIKGNDTTETNYWMELGRNSLREALKTA